MEIENVDNTNVRCMKRKVIYKYILFWWKTGTIIWSSLIPSINIKRGIVKCYHFGGKALPVSYFTWIPLNILCSLKVMPYFYMTLKQLYDAISELITNFLMGLNIKIIIASASCKTEQATTWWIISTILCLTDSKRVLISGTCSLTSLWNWVLRIGSF